MHAAHRKVSGRTATSVPIWVRITWTVCFSAGAETEMGSSCTGGVCNQRRGCMCGFLHQRCWHHQQIQLLPQCAVILSQKSDQLLVFQQLRTMPRSIFFRYIRSHPPYEIRLEQCENHMYCGHGISSVIFFKHYITKFCRKAIYKYLTLSKKQGIKVLPAKENLPNPCGSGRFLERDTGVEPAS